MALDKLYNFLKDEYKERTLQIIQSFKCGLSKKKKVKIQQIPSSLFSENKTRNLDSSPIKIYVDYEIIEDQLPKEILTNIQEAFNLTIKIFQNYLSVKSKGKYKLNKKLINDVKVISQEKKYHIY